jgi:ribulose-bisphosphate carboxylase large chain
MSRIGVTFRVCSDAESIEADAQAIAVEQSVEMPLGAIDDAHVLAEIVGRVEDIRDNADGTYRVHVSLATETTGFEAAQLINMIFGNSSIHEHVTLEDADFPQAVLDAFGGPNHGLDGLRKRCGAEGRAMTCSALKPQGLPVAGLAALAGRFARGGVDFIKDDHGLADQTYSRFADRVPACAKAVRAANADTGGHTRYVPSLSGHLDMLREQLRIARAEGIDTALIPPMVAGLPAFHAVVREFPDFAFMAHPSMAGGGRIAAPFLFGKLFRLLGADATIFVNYGGRFSYPKETCKALAETALEPWGGIKPCVPVPAGGMTLDRVDEMLDFYGRDVMLLIGGALLETRERLTEETAAFMDKVVGYAA